MIERKIVLVTGASSGFGQVTASLLSERGFTVFGTSRKPPRDQPARFEILSLDVDSDRSANACVAAVVKKAGPVDVLVNNAGYALTGGIEETSLEEAKAQFETNFFGPVRMVKAVLPSMRQRRRGKIINIGSVAGTIPVPFEGFYAAAKAALLAYSEALRHEVKSFNIDVSVVEPGFFKTNIGSARRLAAESIEDYREARQRAVGRLEQHLAAGANPNVVAETILRIIEIPSPRLRYPVGREKRYVFVKKITPARTFESSIRRHWRLDE
jgi:short-subunit dehydrogenase